MTDNIAALLNVSNITNEPAFAFLGDKRFSNQFDEFGRTVEFGVRLQF